MSYNYTNGDGKAALTATEPANSDSIAASCAQAIRQIKAYLRDTTNGVDWYSKTAADAAIAAAVAGIPANVAGTKIFKARAPGTQQIVFGAAGTTKVVVTLSTEVFDPDGCFAANRHTPGVAGYYTYQAEIYSVVSAGSPTSVDPIATFMVDAVDLDALNNPGIHQGAEGLTGATTAQLSNTNYVELALSVTVDAACTIDILSAMLTGFRIR